MRDQEIPPGARVGIDLACEACGYNLRTLNVHSRCPECGTDVLTTLRVHTSPLGKGEAFRRLGEAVLCLLGILPALVPTACVGIIGAAILGFGAVRSVRASAEIRTAIARADALFFANIIHLVLVCMLGVAVAFEVLTMGGPFTAKWWLLGGYALNSTGIMLLVGFISRRVGQRTDYVIIVRESNALIGLSAGVFVLAIAALVEAIVSAYFPLLIVLAGFGWLCCVILAATTLFHVVNAVEKERIALADLIEHA